jgi:hypothetical protein
LASRILVQADKFGARTAVPKEAVGLRRENGHYHIGLSGDGEVKRSSTEPAPSDEWLLRTFREGPAPSGKDRNGRSSSSEVSRVSERDDLL